MRLAWLLLALCATLAACGGATNTADDCPHRTHQETAPDGSSITVDNTSAEDQQICAYLAYLQTNVHDGVVDCAAQVGVTGGCAGAPGE